MSSEDDDLAQATARAWQVIDYVRRQLDREPGSPLGAWEVSESEIDKALEAQVPEAIVGNAVRTSYRYRQGRGDYAGTTSEAVVETFLWANWMREGNVFRIDSADVPRSDT